MSRVKLILLQIKIYSSLYTLWNNTADTQRLEYIDLPWVVIIVRLLNNLCTLYSGHSQLDAFPNLALSEKGVWCCGMLVGWLYHYHVIASNAWRSGIVQPVSCQSVFCRFRFLVRGGVVWHRD